LASAISGKKATGITAVSDTTIQLFTNALLFNDALDCCRHAKALSQRGELRKCKGSRQAPICAAPTPDQAGCGADFCA
jgi:hypothetical protein